MVRCFFQGLVVAVILACGCVAHLRAQTVISGTYNSQTIAGDIVIAASTNAVFTNGSTFTGANATFNTGGGLYWQQVGTLSGKAFTLGNGSYLYISGVNNALTLDSATTVTGDASVYSDGSTGQVLTTQGTITHTSSASTGNIYARTFTNSGNITATAGTLNIGNSSALYSSANSGTITSDGAGANVQILGNLANTGTIRAQNSGTLRFQGTNSSANFGTVQIGVGSHGYLQGTITNNSATFNAPATGVYELLGGTIQGGTIAAGALTYTGSGGYFDGATLSGNLTLPAGSHVRFTNGGGFNGATGTFGNNAGVYWQQVGTLSGKAFTIGSGGYLYVAGINNQLTLDATTSVTGDASVYSDGSTGQAITTQGTLTHNLNTGGQIYARTFTNTGTITGTNGTLTIGSNSGGYTSANSGTILSDGVNGDVRIMGDFANTGTIRAQNGGVLYFQGTNSSANLGTVHIGAGSRGFINGTITNTSATLNPPATGVYELLSGTIQGGTIASGAVTFTSSGGYFDGATLTGNLSTPASSNVRFTNGATFTGTNATFANSSGVYWQQVGTLSGKAITIGNGGYLYVAGVNNQLTLDATTTVTGDASVYSDGSAGQAITTQGTITHTANTGGQIYARTYTNTGNITGSAGTLTIGNTSSSYSSSNSGTIVSDGANGDVRIAGNFANTGTIRAQNGGVLYFQGTNASANLGTVQIGTGSRGYLNGTITNTSATLNPPATGIYELLNGTIQGGTIASGALTFTSSGGILDGASIAGNLSTPASSVVRFTNGATFTGPTATFAGNSGVYWQQVGTLSGKAFTIGNGGYLYIAGVNNQLTLDATTTVTGDASVYSDGSAGQVLTTQGTISHTANTGGQIYARSYTNTGNITATNGTLTIGNTNSGYTSSNSGFILSDGASGDIRIAGNFANIGTIRAQNSGKLYFQGTNSSANLGTVQIAAGSHGYLNGTITNTSATLAAPATGTYELLNGTIQGGTIAAGALTFTSSGGFLDGASVTGNLSTPSGSVVRFTNGATFTGSNADFATNSGVYWQQVGTLLSKAFTLANGAYLYVAGANNQLTLDANTTVTGDASVYSDGSAGQAITTQGTIAHTANTGGQIYARTYTNTGNITASNGTLTIGNTNSGYTSSNSGFILSDGASGDIRIAGNFANTGTIRAQNSGKLYFQGTNSSANLGTVQIAAGSHGYLNGTITNTSATLAAPATGTYELLNGTIQGGTIANGALTFTSSGGFLDAATYLGNLTLPTGSLVRFTNGTNFTGSTANFGSSAGVYWQQVGTLSGKSITIGSGGYLYVAGANNALTIASDTSVTGDASLYTDGSAGQSITNFGTLTHNINTGGQLYAGTWTNSGSVIVSAGTMNIGSSSTNYSFANNSGALIRLNGGNVSLQSPAASPIVNNGTIDVQSGTLFTNNHLTNGASGVIRGAGTISGNVTVAGGTVAPGNSVGTLTVSSGAFAITGATVFAVELSGASADQLVFQNPPSVVSLGTGLLTLSLTLLAPPTDNTTYNIIRISSGGSGITGTFAGLPTSGSTFNATFNSVNYPFTVNYATNVVSLNFASVPEPSTWVLLGAGMAVLALGWWRRGAKR